MVITSTPPGISVVVVSYNSTHVLSTCLGSIRTHLPTAEIVLVDNASSDSPSRASEEYGTHLVQLPQNEGFGFAVNAGVRAASNGLILILNPDAVIDRVDPRALRAAMDCVPFGLGAPLLRSSSTEPARHHVAIDGSWYGETFRYLWAPFRRRRTTRLASGGEDALWVSGAALLVRRAEFLSLGGFEVAFFLYWEDRDLSRRCLQQGLPIRQVAAIEITHIQGTSTRTNLRPNVSGWNFHGLIEHIARAHGSRRARLAAVEIVATLFAQDLILRGAKMLIPHRWVQRKSAEIIATRRAVRAGAYRQDGTPSRCWPEARLLLSRIMKAPGAGERAATDAGD